MKKKLIDSSLKKCALDIPPEFTCEEENVLKIVERLKIAIALDDQQKIIRHLSTYVTPSEDPQTSYFACGLMSYLFLTINCKYPIKKTIGRILSSIDESLLTKCLQEKITYVITNFQSKSAEEKNEVILNLQHCNSFLNAGAKAISATIKDVVKFSVDYLIDLTRLFSDRNLTNPDELQDILQYIANLVKFFVAFLQCENVGDCLKEDSERLLIATYKIIMDDIVQFEVKCNTSQILIQAMNNLPEEIRQTYQFQTPCFQLLAKQDGVIQQFDISTNETAKISVYTAILHLVPGEHLASEKINDTTIISYLFTNLIDMAKGSSGKPSQVLIVTKTLGLLSKMLEYLPTTDIEKLFRLGIEYIWANLDYHIDAVRQKTREVFKNFIKLAVSYGNRGESLLIKIVLSYLTDLLVNRCAHYIAFNLLAEETGMWFVLQYFNNLPLILLMHLDDTSLAPSICNTYEALMHQHLREEDDNELWMATWIELLKPLLKRSEPPTTGYYQRLFIYAFQINPTVVKSILHYQHLSSPNELGALLGCVRWARKNISKLLATQQNNKNSIDQSHLWRELLEYKTLELNMCHQSDEIRIHILALVVECQKSTEVFSAWELEFLKKYFKYNVTSQVPNTVQQIKALYKKALLRIKEGNIVIQRQINTTNRLAQRTPDHEKFLEHLIMQEQSYSHFLETFIEDHLKLGLLPWANHYRRSLCLEIISAAQECVTPELWKKLWKPTDLKNLSNILNDSYESNIILASSVIRSVPKERAESTEELAMQMNVILNKATSIKVSASLSAAYVFELLLEAQNGAKALKTVLDNKHKSGDVVLMAINLLILKAEQKLAISKANILTAAKCAPFYGVIFCIRHLLEKQDTNQYPHWNYLAEKLINLCTEVSSVVCPIVNSLSPEGYIPLDEVPQGEELDESAIAQMILVFAWRTVKEVSLLLGELAAKVPFKDVTTGKEILDIERTTKMSHYFRSTFYETKHRGAYEQAYVGFCRLCHRLWTTPNETMRNWPKMWLEEILDMLMGKDNEETFNRLCATRRSAGLPFMIVAILTTEPTKLGNPMFTKCINKLITIGQDFSPSNEKALTHAMNILRVIYRHTQLGDVVTPYIEEGVKIAINGFASSTWGVRNAATLLFSALVTRIFGVQRNKDCEDLSLKNRMTARVFFMRYPALFTFMLAKLRDGTHGKADSLSVHPILIILARLYPTNTEDEQQLVQYLPLVNLCLSHCQYRTRELAAQASIPLIPRRNFVDYAIKLLMDLADVTLTNNHCHGLILQLSFLLKRIPDDTGTLDVPEYIENTFWIFMSAGRFISHNTAALYMDMVIQLTDTFSKNCIGQPIFTKMGEMLLWRAVYERHHEFSVSTGGHAYRRSRLLLLFQIVNILCETSDYLKSLFINEFVVLCINSEDIEVTEFVLNTIHCLNIEHPFYVKSSLYILEMLEFPENVNAIIQKMDFNTRLNAAKSLHGLIDNKMIENFNFLLNRNKCSAVKLFLVMQHFVCLLPYLKLTIQNTLAYFLKWCLEGDDMLVCASFGCISMLFYHSLDEEIRTLDFADVIKAVIHYSAPTATLHERLAVCQFLVHNKKLFCEANDYVKVENKIQFWNAVMILLEDNDQIIRETISTLCTKTKETSTILGDEGLNIIADKAREELIDIMINAIPQEDAVRLLLLWSLRKQYNPLPDDDGDETASSLTDVLFDKGELNTYAEDESLAMAALEGLKKILWTLPDGLNYADKSIFIEEHTHLVATILYNAIYQAPETLMPAEARITCMCILKRMRDFLDSQPVNQTNFMFLFENALIKEVINITFTKDPLKHSASDRFKYLFKKLFNIED